MSQFRVYHRNRHVATVWAHDEDEACCKVARITGAMVTEFSAVDTFEHGRDRDNEC